jgi:hypothetical protein
MDKENESTNQLLRVIIALLLEQSESFSTLKAKVAFLNRIGMGPTEIASILGKTKTHISKELAGIRKPQR